MNLVEQLIARGVVVHAPESVVVDDVDPAGFEPGVEVFPGCTIVGRHSRYGAGTKLGNAGGGTFRNVRAGRGVELRGGYFDDCVFLDGVVLRGQAEVRSGTLLEEGAEGAHHVGYKMTIMLPFVVAGSLINFCDALFAGGTSREDHSEIGSCLALYNFTPWGDKFASMFGDVPRGVFLRSPRIFVGGQTQVVSPVKVGYGAVIPAGLGVRRSVPEGRIHGERMEPIDQEFDPVAYGGLEPKFRLTAEIVGNLRALELWYERVRIPAAADDFSRELYVAAADQVRACIRERIKRLGKIVDKLPASRARHLELAAQGDAESHRRRVAQHDALAERWSGARAVLESDPTSFGEWAPDSEVGRALGDIAASMQGDAAWTERLAALSDREVADGVAALERVVALYSDALA